MNPFNHILCLWVMALFITGCQQMTPDFLMISKTTPLSPIDDFKKVRSNHLSTASLNQIEGSGQIIFTTPLNGILRPHLFHLSFVLNSEQSQVQFNFFQSNQNMNDGLAIEFKRSPDLEVWLHQAGRVSINISEFFIDKPLFMPFHFRVAFQMDTAGLRFAIWDHRHKIIGNNNALLDSVTQNWILDPAQVGSSWGIQFKQVQIMRAYVKNYYPF